MPADAKRKEARKRKFGDLQSASEPGKNDNVGSSKKIASVSRDGVKGGGVDSAPAQHMSVEMSVQATEADEGNADRTTAPEEPDEQDHTTKEKEEDKQPPEEEQQSLSSKQSRFVCFIGNLPYTATTKSISKHFESVKPASVRHSTNKATGKSRGFAFLEFDGYDRMKTCLKLYHHSQFDDGESPARKINVELTAGGGGKSQHRKSKLRLKNEKLNAERYRRAMDEKRQGGGKQSGKDAAAVGAGKESEGGDDSANIHPSRRKQVADG